MSLFADFAKSALKSAQRRIDNVLDIHSEEDAGTEEEENTLETAVDNIIREDPEALHVSHNSSRAGNHEPWQWEEASEDTVVVTEPNPMRDLHIHGDVAICSESPSLSPTDDPLYQRQTTKVESADQTAEFYTASKSLHEDHQIHMDPNPDEIITIASSDIEIIRSHDDRSTISSVKPPAGALSDSQCTSFQYGISTQSNDSNIEHLLASFQSQIAVKDRQIEDMSISNKTLLRNNNSMKQQIKRLTDKISVMNKLQKEMVEKDEQISSLFKEGDKLSQLNGRLLAEIKKLRQEQSNLENITKDRDNALLQAKEANEKVKSAEKSVAEMQEQLKNVEAANKRAIMEVSQTQDFSDSTQKRALEMEQILQDADQQIQQLKMEVAVIQREKDETLAERDEEVRKCLYLHQDMSLKDAELAGFKEENQLLKNKCSRLFEQNNDLECRIRKLMDNERDNAKQIVDANMPLLLRIDELEGEKRVINEQKQMNELQVHKLQNDVANLNTLLQKNNCDFQRTRDEAIKFKQENSNLRKTLENERNELTQKCKTAQDECSATHQTVEMLQQKYNNDIDAERKKQEQWNIDKRFLSQKLATQEAEIERLNSRVNELVTKSAESIENNCTDSTVSSRVLDSPNNAAPVVADFIYSDASNGSWQSELKSLHNVYKQTLLRLQQMQQEMISNNEKMALKDAQIKELDQNYGDLLMEYGARLEHIEELEMDLHEVRAIVSQQAELVAKLQGN